MKGLLIKDFRLLMAQKNVLMIVLLIGVAFMFSNEEPYSAVSYISILFSVLTLSTLTYDESDNGMAFLMTLPIKRRTYVFEKYLFGFLGVGSAWIVSTLLAFTVTVGIRHMESSLKLVAANCLGTVVGGLIILAIFIPIRLKFGAEKERIVIFGIVGAFLVAAYVAGEVCKSFQIDLDEVLSGILQENLKILFVVLVAVFLVVIGISYAVSVRIVKKKEF